MKLKKALSLLLSMVIILNCSVPYTFATQIYVDESSSQVVPTSTDPTICEECGLSVEHTENCSQKAQTPKESEEPIESTLNIGDVAWIKPDRRIYKSADDTQGALVRSSYEIVINDIIFDDDNTPLWYVFEFKIRTERTELIDYSYIKIDDVDTEKSEDNTPVISDQCTCGDNAPEDLAEHSETCPRKEYTKNLIKSENDEYKTAEEIYAQWADYDTATQTDILNIVRVYNSPQYQPLLQLLSGESSETPDAGLNGVTVSGIPTGVVPTVEKVETKDIPQDVLAEIGNCELNFALDITLKDDENEWQPAEGEKATVSLDASQLGLNNGDNVAVFHSHNGTLKNLGTFTVTDGRLTFETDGFSVFYGYTVDFEYDGTWYSIGGCSDVYLYELFAMLGIDKDHKQVTDVTVSNTDLFCASKVTADGYTGEKAWIIHSLKPFDTAETITITFSDGSVIKLNVYDANYNYFTSGNYTLNSGDTIGPVSIPDGSNVTLTLNGEVTANGTISVGNNVTLTINGSGTLKRADYFTDKMFYVAGGKLIISGNADSNIIIDGNASYSATPIANSTRKTLQTIGTSATSSVIYVGYEGNAPRGIAPIAGNVELKNVTMQHLYSTSQAPAVHITGSTTDALYSTVSMTNVTVKDSSTIGSDAIVLFNDAIADLTNCTFTNNYSGGVYAGAVKSGGPQWFSQLNMTNCIATGNYSAGWGGVILWAANNSCGDKTSKATIANCNFTGNTARWLGGGISNEAIMEVKGTTIKNNIAMAGGGIATFPFTLTESDVGGREACGLTLGEGNIIKNNTAYASGNFTPYSKQDIGSADGDDVKPIDNQITYTGGGGGVWCYMNKPNWTCSLEIGSGNNISNNTSNNVGGGVYVDKVAGNTTILSITGATVSGNKAVNGGGVAVKNADVTVSSGLIKSNTASKNGGGIYVESGSSTVSGTGSITQNNAKNGGGIYIKDGSIDVTGGIISYNKATGSYSGNTTKTDDDNLQGVGGGIYLKKGSFKLSGEYIGIYSNTADVAADDVYTQGNGTTLTLPEVKNMNLTGMLDDSRPTGWYADYKPNDTEYPQSIIETTNPGRYDKDKSGNVEITHPTLTANTKTFYCLTLGIETGSYGSLTISKTGIENIDHNRTDEKQNTVFHITGTTNSGVEISLYATVVGNDSVTIQYLPNGEYTVTEVTDWSWRYDKTSQRFYPVGSDSSENSIVISVLNPNWNADFTNQRTETKWLSGDWQCKNIWSGNQSADDKAN